MSIVSVALPLSHTNAHPSLPGNESGKHSGNDSGNNLSSSSYLTNRHTFASLCGARRLQAWF